MHSGLILSEHSDRPRYLQIVDQVKRKVALGDWRPESEIPSIRALAAELSVSVITVKRAYAELEEEGVIVTRQGRGTFVSRQGFRPEGRASEERIRARLEETLGLARIEGWTWKQLQPLIVEVWAAIENEGDR